MFHSLEKFIEGLIRGLVWVSTGMLFVMMSLLSINVVIRLYYKPILGIYELVGLMTAIVIAFALAYTELLKGHIEVDLLVSRLPQRAQAILACIQYAVTLGMICIIAWQTILQGNTTRYQWETSGVLPVPVFPVVYGLAFGFVLFGLILLVELFHSFRGVSK